MTSASLPPRNGPPGAVRPRKRLSRAGVNTHACARLALALALLVLAGATEPSSGADEPIEPGKLLYLLEYVGADYGFAVRNGEIASLFEYEEMLTFSRLLVQHVDNLRSHGASAEVETGLVELLDMILSRAPVETVRSHAAAIVERLLVELDTVRLPQSVPDLERGRKMYAANCAPCHGVSGAGDGPSSPGMDPPATSFRDRRMQLIAPYQLFGATTFGVDDTAMPEFGWIVGEAEIWDVSFYLMTLRGGFDPSGPDPGLSISLADLATRSNEQLLQQVRGTREDVRPSQIDYYRRNIPRVRVKTRLNRQGQLSLTACWVMAGQLDAAPAITRSAPEESTP